MPPYYLAFDVDRIQDTLFQCNWIRLVRDGSRRISEVVSEHGIREGLAYAVGGDAASSDIIFADGGSGLIKVPGNHSTSTDAGARLEEWFERRTKFATLAATTLSCDWQPKGRWAEPSQQIPRFAPLAPTTFGQIYQRLALDLDRRKTSRHPAFFEAVSASGQLCETCGLRLATSKKSERQICLPCSARYQADVRGNYAYDTLEELATDGLIALVYLDGNNVGDKRRKAADSEANLRSFARRLADLINSGLRAIAQNGNHAPLALGGDDIAVIVGGKEALTVLHQFHQAVAEPARKLGISFSAGIMVAPHHTPIPLFHRAAVELCRSAKEYHHRLGRQNQHDEWTCDIAVSTGSSPMASDVLALRRDHLVRRCGAEVLRLYGGPFRMADIEQRCKAIQDSKLFGVSESSLRNTAEACLSMSRSESTLFVRAQWARDGGLRSWAAKHYPKRADFPWRQSEHDRGELVTDLVDLVRWRSCFATDLAQQPKAKS